MARHIIDFNIPSLNRFNKRLTRMGRLLTGMNIVNPIQSRLPYWGNRVRNDIIRGMQNTDRAPWSYKRGTVVHRPSKPYSFPAIDTGQLVANILFNVGPMMIEIGPARKIKYAKFLEEGTKKMIKRPFIEPSWKKNQPVFQKDMANIVRKIFRNSTRRI